MVERAVEAANMVGNIAAQTDLSVWGLIAQADMVVKIVMLFLLLASFCSWTIIFDKFTSFKKMRVRMAKFEDIFRKTKLLDGLYDRMNKSPNDNPQADMFIAAVSEIRYGVLKDTKNPSPELIDNCRGRVFQSISRIKHRALEKMEKDLIFLATVGSASPFIGLFGTVWGIVNSFQAIGISKNTSLAVVAPGIAEALIATAMGLFAAIPAVIFYNFFSNQIRLSSAKLEDFQGELITILDPAAAGK
jgi:biopolymer transport protein TolQ